MSFETWKEEFYPIPAKEVLPEQAVAHSLKKWQGLLSENLTKHNVRIGQHYCSNYVTDDKDPRWALSINGDSCALCATRTCWQCEIFKETDETCNDEDSAYAVFCNTSDPRPMVKLLETIHQKETAK